MNNKVAAAATRLLLLPPPSSSSTFYTTHTLSTLPSVGKTGVFHCIVTMLVGGGGAPSNDRPRFKTERHGQIFPLFPPRHEYTATNGAAVRAPRPLHACQGLVDPAPPHSKSPLTFGGPDSVTIVNTCWKGMVAAASLLSWQAPTRHVSSGAPPPRLFNQPGSLPAGARLRYISYLRRPSLAF